MYSKRLHKTLRLFLAVYLLLCFTPLSAAGCFILCVCEDCVRFEVMSLASCGCQAHRAIAQAGCSCSSCGCITMARNGVDLPAEQPECNDFLILADSPKQLKLPQLEPKCLTPYTAPVAILDVDQKFGQSSQLMYYCTKQTALAKQAVQLLM